MGYVGIVQPAPAPSPIREVRRVPTDRPPRRAPRQARHAHPAREAGRGRHVRPRQGVVGRGHRAPDGPPARPAGPDVGRSQALRAGRPPGHRCRRQGRHDRQGHGGLQPAGLSGQLVQGAVRRGARPRLPVAGPQAHAAARARSASSTARTTRTCSSFGSTTSCPSGSGRSATTRSTTSSGCWRTSGTTIVKFFLSIDREEQRKRFQERYDDPTKRWKFSLGDLDERKLWDSYQAAFDEALSKTSTPWAPWYVIPANRNWFRNLAVSTILADTMAGLKPAYPAPPDLPPNLVVE